MVHYDRRKTLGLVIIVLVLVPVSQRPKGEPAADYDLRMLAPKSDSEVALGG